jgi:signal transduction histidine kinase
VDVAIRDGSGGFDPEQLPRMGERFHRPLGGVGTGSGPGLSIARAGAALHHGEILLGRSAGGAEVVLRLPRLQSGVAQ